MPKIDDTARQNLRAQYGEVHTLSSPRLAGHEFAFRKPGAVEFDALMAALAARDVNEKVHAHRQFAKDLLVFPSEAEFDALGKELPGLAHTFGVKLAELAGLDADLVVGKG